ncbi:hypothetical protein SAMN05216276_108811 [Streptosporangium subroseum]|uniref:Uncharacterized protein n=1 Tax=Streptosporangium subroseum TaxID=106412 RepID=A0A239P650_9ACTN|nr:hypothetical protein [Streptosporangium subroseum]SNT62134.1 hypothetical protein SAMN05216276_108811 [Streptosporangium subroseum]
MNPRPEDLVPNPRRQVLEQTLAEVRARVAILEAALDPAHGQFTGQPVWVGPTGRRFAEDLSARRARLRQAASALVDALEEELRSVPAEVPPSVTRH